MKSRTADQLRAEIKKIDQQIDSTDAGIEAAKKSVAVSYDDERALEAASGVLTGLQTRRSSLELGREGLQSALRDAERAELVEQHKQHRQRMESFLREQDQAVTVIENLRRQLVAAENNAHRLSELAYDASLSVRTSEELLKAI